MSHFNAVDCGATAAVAVSVSSGSAGLSGAAGEWLCKATGPRGGHQNNFSSVSFFFD